MAFTRLSASNIVRFCADVCRFAQHLKLHFTCSSHHTHAVLPISSFCSLFCSLNLDNKPCNNTQTLRFKSELYEVSCITSSAFVENHEFCKIFTMLESPWCLCVLLFYSQQALLQKPSNSSVLTYVSSNLFRRNTLNLFDFSFSVESHSRFPSFRCLSLFHSRFGIVSSNQRKKINNNK